MELCLAVYEIIPFLPSSERFALSQQIRKAAVSVPANIAEGQACGEDGRYIHHLRIALGSLAELSTELELAERLAMLPRERARLITEHLTRTGQILHGLLRARRHLRQANLLPTFWGFAGLRLALEVFRSLNTSA